MLTLQILDRDQQFLVPLADPTILVGSAPAAGLRLSDAAPEHARIANAADGTTAELQAIGDAPVRVNGEPVRSATLRLGDRIEIGSAVLVVGKSVTRPKRPDEVIEGSPLRGVARTRRKQRSALLPIVVALAVAGGVVVYALQQDSGVPLEVVELDRLRRAGSLDLAHAHLQRLQQTWSARGEAERALLDDAAARLAELDAAVAARRDKVLAEAAERGYAELSNDLQYEERRGDETARIAARLVRASLDELVREGKRLAAERRTADPAHDGGASGADPGTGAASTASTAGAALAGEPGSRGAVGTGADGPAVDGRSGTVNEGGATGGTATVDATAASELEPVLADVDRLAGSGLFAQALAVLQSALANARPADAALLEQRRGEVHRDATAALDALLARARDRAEAGAFDEAIAGLATAEARFPADGPFARLPDTLRLLRTAQEARVEAERRARAQLAQAEAAAPPAPAVDEATRRVTLEQVRALLDRIRSLEIDGDFAGAAAAMREGAALVAQRDPDYAERLGARAGECEQIAALQRHAAELFEGGRRIEVPLRSGRVGALHGTAGHRLQATTSDGEIEVSWLDVAADGVALIAASGKLPTEAQLGAAALLYRNGEPGAAEALLAKLHRADVKARPDIDRAIARGRGEPADERGYTLGKDGFVSARAIEAQKQAQKLLSKLDAALRSKDPKVRQSFLDDALAQGPLTLEPIVLAFRKELQKQVEQLGKSTLKKQLDRLAAQRELLDQARAHAKELIYDEVKYFYPYKPPQVSAERFAEYTRVQAEVDRRVASLRSLWNDDRAKVRVPATLRTDLDRLDWVASALGDLGELDQNLLAEVAWARALPPGDTVTIATYCTTIAERDELVLWQRIEALNAQLERDIEAGERDQLRITNAYRAMFRHRPLALRLQIAEAARGHAQEMSALGYFAHFSPTPGRRTPFDRMKLAGYDYGVSENIALTDGPEGAHGAWCRSSGHHRNLLNPAHTEFGVGGLGRYWVQNFGRGKLYEDDPLWAKTAGEK